MILERNRFIAFHEQCMRCAYGMGKICTLDADCAKCKMCFNRNKAEQSCHCGVIPSKDEKMCKFFKEVESK